MDSSSARNAWVQIFCGRDRGARIATFIQAGNEWHLYSVSHTETHRPGQSGGLPVAGSFGISPQYGGCPGCGSNSYVCWNACGELGCWSSATRYFTCGHCGRGGEVKGRIESVNTVDAG